MPPFLPARPGLALSPSSATSSSTSSAVCRLALLQRPDQPRSFTTTLPRQTKTIKPHLLPSHIIPPYPYGDRTVYKQSNRGLYGNSRIQFGNNVSEKHNVKTQRFWRPNVHIKTFHVPELSARVKTRLTLRVLKTIRKEGSLVEYVLKSKPARVKELGPGGWKLRWLLMQTQAVQERFNEERVALGLEPKEIEDNDDVIQYALDSATPGNLSKKSQDTAAQLRQAELLAQTFPLGDLGMGEEDMAEMAEPEELTDEQEELLLSQLDEDGPVKTTTERQSVQV